MREYLKKVLSFNGVSIFLGTAGSVLGITVFFFPTIQTARVDVKNVLGLIYVLICIIIVLFKIVFDLVKESKSTPNTKTPYAIPFRYNNELKSLIIHNDYLFEYNTMLTIYFDDSGCEYPIGFGFVNNRQDLMTQIKIARISSKYESVVVELEKGDVNILKHIVIKAQMNQSITEEFIK